MEIENYILHAEEKLEFIIRKYQSFKSFKKRYNKKNINFCQIILVFFYLYLSGKIKIY